MASRQRFAWLCLAHFAGVVADVSLLLTAFLKLLDDFGTAARGLASFFALLLISALVGALVVSTLVRFASPRRVLLGTSIVRLGLVVVLLCLVVSKGENQFVWAAAIVGVALVNTLSNPFKYGLLRSLAHPLHLSLSRLHAWMAMATFAGMFLWLLGSLGFISVAALLAALLTWIATRGMLWEQTAPQEGYRTLLATPAVRQPFLALACFWFLAAAIGYVLLTLPYLPRPEERPSAVTSLTGPFFPGLFPVACGAALGSLIAGRTAHPYRVLGWVPWGWLGLTTACLLLAGRQTGMVRWALLGLSASWILVPLNSAYQRNLPTGLTVSGLALLNLVKWLAIAAGVGVSAAVLGLSLLTPSRQLYVLAALAGLIAILAFRKLLREVIEMTAEIVSVPMYRFQLLGPGLEQFPEQGPVLVIGNHGAWFDPLFLGKYIPRRITALMSSLYYDLPILSWLMRRVFRTIRVQESKFRQQAPELAQAVKRLERGECVMIFPEGWLRRSEEQVIRHFGQGVWRILRDRPQTPVVACWIEGSWGSMTSHWNGPPGKGKPFDWRHPITVVMGGPELVPEEVLAEHRRARQYLMEKVLALREHLPGSKGVACVKEN